MLSVSLVVHMHRAILTRDSRVRRGLALLKADHFDRGIAGPRLFFDHFDQPKMVFPRVCGPSYPSVISRSRSDLIPGRACRFPLRLFYGVENPLHLILTTVNISLTGVSWRAIPRACSLFSTVGSWSPAPNRIYLPIGWFVDSITTTTTIVSKSTIFWLRSVNTRQSTLIGQQAT